MATQRTIWLIAKEADDGLRLLAANESRFLAWHYIDVAFGSRDGIQVLPVEFVENMEIDEA